MIAKFSHASKSWWALAEKESRLCCFSFLKNWNCSIVYQATWYEASTILDLLLYSSWSDLNKMHRWKREEKLECFEWQHYSLLWWVLSHWKAVIAFGWSKGRIWVKLRESCSSGSPCPVLKCRSLQHHMFVLENITSLVRVEHFDTYLRSDRRKRKHLVCLQRPACCSRCY